MPAEESKPLRSGALERFCLREYLRFAKRHSRYLKIMVWLYAASLLGWRRRRALRFGYCYLQYIDDLLDGDRLIEDDPLLAVRELVTHLADETVGADPFSQIGQVLLVCLQEHAREGDCPKDDIIRLIHTMMEDYRRRCAGLLLEAGRLQAHHRHTFHYSVNLMLIALDCQARASEVKHLIEAFGICSTLRDLRADLAKGLCNLPIEVVLETGSDKPAELDLAHPAILAWRQRELVRASRLLERAHEEIMGLADPHSRRVLNIFYCSMQRVFNRCTAGMPLPMGA